MVFTISALVGMDKGSHKGCYRSLVTPMSNPRECPFPALPTLGLSRFCPICQSYD